MMPRVTKTATWKFAPHHLRPAALYFTPGDSGSVRVLNKYLPAPRLNL
jgi:hypothetical protein